MYRPCSHIIMEKLKTTLLRPTFQNTDLDENVKTIDPYFKFKLLTELLEIFTKCEDKCGTCVDYLIKLCQHIGDIHDNVHDLDTDDVYSDSSDFIRHPSPNSCHSEPVQPINSEDASTLSKSSNTNVSKSSQKTIGARKFAGDNSYQNNVRSHEEYDEGDSEKSTNKGVQPCTSPSNIPSSARNSKAHENKSNLNRKTFNSNSREFCGKVFPNRCRLDRHLLSHTGEKPFECETCGERFQYKQNLKDHNHKHTGERPYKCDICDKSFSYSGNVRYHKLLARCKRNKSKDNRKVILNSKKCLTCGEMFLNRCALNSHSKVNSENENHQFYCGVCGKCFFYKCSLVKHQTTHTGEKQFR